MTSTTDKGLEHLQVWQKAIQFAIYVCQHIINKLPDSEKYALTTQIRRSAESIPANIAEGHGRYYFQESVRFAYISRGSLEETLSHLVFAHEMKYLTDADYQDIYIKYSELWKMINGYINYLKNSRIGIKEPGSEYAVTNENLI